MTWQTPGVEHRQQFVEIHQSFSKTVSTFPEHSWTPEASGTELSAEIGTILRAWNIQVTFFMGFP